MITTILVGTDGSEAAAAAERYGVELAARLKARVVGVSVVEDRLTRAFRDDGLGLPPPPLDALAKYLHERAGAAGKRISEMARDAAVEATFETVEGIADDRVVERSQEADLVVVGRDGQDSDFRTGLIGATVNGVIRKAATPTLVVPRGAQLNGPILLAFDGSPGSRVGAKLAVQLATRLAEPIHVFVDSKDKGRAIARFEEVRGLVGSLPVPVREVSSTLGRPDVKIIDSAREAGAAMIVMGVYGRNRITDYFLGSNSAAVVRTSPAAVLLAR